MKTIEEAINDISNQLLSGMDKNSYTKDEVGDAFDKILMQVHALPLSDRLTAEERERIKTLYRAELEAANEYRRKANLSVSRTCKDFYNLNREICIGRLRLFEHIFGKAIFSEEGGEK